MGDRNLLQTVLQYCWYSGILCVKVQWQKQLVLNFANTMSKVEAENNYACVLPVFQHLPLARDGKEGPRLRIVLNVCLFFRRKRSDWGDGASHPRGSFAWQISTLSHELDTCLNVPVVEGNPIKICYCSWMCWLKVLTTWGTREKMWLVICCTVGYVEIGR